MRSTRKTGAALLALSVIAVRPASAAEPAPTPDVSATGAVVDKTSDVKVFDPPKADLSAHIQARKSYVIPALEILGFDFLLNRINNSVYSGNDYKGNMSSIRLNLRASLAVGNYPLKINQLWRPYQGSMYHGFAHSTGLNYWESLGYTFVGSALWETAGERTAPAKKRSDHDRHKRHLSG